MLIDALIRMYLGWRNAGFFSCKQLINSNVAWFLIYESYSQGEKWLTVYSRDLLRGQVCNLMRVKMWDFYEPYRTKSFISNHSWQTTIVQLIGQGSKMNLPQTDRDLLPSSALILQVHYYLIYSSFVVLIFKLPSNPSNPSKTSTLGYQIVNVAFSRYRRRSAAFPPGSKSRRQSNAKFSKILYIY